ncbi:hypothetical protein PPTG_08234 [Phytophthora nicotianae INRA-310]|uniref:CBF1-interacting co-repressor CIR N-terminal domain-containing protein n=2 Tax=Phytophthora nicotianae (strain INRA-310) TaxID=761204 RepID=W2QKG3_PHYN3|nr:hypothetical protein PPTG_08234 [Phytophthora nicotianae INRA-310]ETN13386.1 hypothetical protein PPTG_08234 [Phytophthora nicotianae INRA-310]
MSLAFLSKKSWHTANLRNVEKVWIAEQKHAAEEKKVAELRKNIEEERQLQELRQLQAARGDKSAAVERLDWMYEGPSAAREKTAEEYLLGKEYKGEDEKAAKGDVDLSTTTKYGSLALTKSALPANDAFQRLNEDPMMLIRKRQQAAREQVLKNPVKMKRIKDEVDRVKEDKKARKKAKKAAKKEKNYARKEEKRRLKRKHDDDSVSDTSADEKEEKTSRRHKDYPSKHHRGHGRESERGRSCSRSESRSRSPLSVRHHGDRDRSRPHHSDREPARHESSHAKNRSSRDRYVNERRGRGSSRDRRVSSTTRDRRYRSRSRSTRRHEQRGRSRSRSPKGRDDFGRDRPPARPTDGSINDRSRTPPRREHKLDTHRHYDERSRSRSPVDRRERRRSLSPIDRRDRRQSRSSGRDRDSQRHRSPSRRESTRRERNSSRDRARKSGEERGDSRRHKEPESRRKPVDTDGKYGLISKAGAVESKDVDKSSLGPNAKYLAKAREAKRLEEEERRRKLGKSSRPEQRELTGEEKMRMAQQMVEDAKQRDKYIAKRATLKKDELDKREQEASNSNTNPEFLRKLHSEAYLDGESNMSDRLRRNAHYIQRKADASNFLSK